MRSGVRWILTIALAAIGSVGVHALPDNTSPSSAEGAEPALTSKPVEHVSIGYVTGAQILCLKKRRVGTRLIVRRCQSIAEWKAEIASEQARKYLLEM